jgi:hypothetical protein
MLKVEKLSGLRALPERYSLAFENAARQSFFLSLPWFQNVEEVMVEQNQSVQVYGVEELEGRPVAVWVLLHSSNSGGKLSPATLTGLSNYYSSLFGPALVDDPGEMAEMSEAFAKKLWADRSSWDVINLQPLDRESELFGLLLQAFKTLGMPVQTYFCFGNWYLDVANRSFAEYFAGLPTVLRKNVPYMSRRLERSGRGRIEIITAEKGLERALDDYESVYLSSWKKSEGYPAFIRGWARSCAKNGWLRLGLIYVDDRPAAAQLWIVHAGVASIFKVCYDEQFSKLSVGTILTSELMRHVIDMDKVKMIDYLSGDDAYKKDWMSNRRERWGIIAFNPRSLKGIAQAVRHIGGRSAKEAFSKMGISMIKAI